MNDSKFRPSQLFKVDGRFDALLLDGESGMAIGSIRRNPLGVRLVSASGPAKSAVDSTDLAVRPKIKPGRN